MKKLLLVIITILAIAGMAGAQNIEVLATNIRSGDGQLLISIFKDKASFKDEKPYNTMYFKKSGIVKGQMTVKFTLPPGTYGFALVDDENSNKDMNYNFIGYPTEGFGFSNYYHTGLTKPDFDSFKFTLVKNQKQKITIKIRYM